MAAGTLFDDAELFNSGTSAIVHYDIPDAELVFREKYFEKDIADEYYRILLNDTEWKQELITVYNKTHITPRLTAWFGIKGQAWTPALIEIKNKVEENAHTAFNGVLLNLYRNGSDGVGWHRDNDREYGTNPVIGSVSFGATRRFQIRHKFRKELDKIEIPLTHGSFLLMGGTMQHYWEHQVPKTAKLISPRINLTFRVIK